MTKKPTRVYIDRGALEANDRQGGYRPPIVVEHADGTKVHCFGAVWDGPGSIVYDPAATHPHVWLEVRGAVQAQTISPV